MREQVRTKVAERLKRLFHRDLEERDWKKIAGDIVQLALEPPTEEEARLAYEEYTVYEGSSTLSMFHALRRFVERRSSAVPPQFKAGDRVRIENCPGSLQGKLGYIHKVVDEWNYIVCCDNGSFQSVHASWLKSAPQFKDGQRVRVRVTGQAGRISGTNPAGDVLEVKYEGTSSIGLYKVEGLEPAPFKVGDRVRWRFGSSLPFCYGQVKYLSNERAGVRIDGQVVEVVEWLLEAEPISWKEWSGVVPLDPANYQAAKPQFKAGDRVRWKGTAQTGTVSGVFAFGKLDVALDSGGWLNNYSPDGFEFLGPAEPRTFIKHFLERVRGQEFTHEEAELLRTHIAIRERTPKPTELRCPFCGGTGSLSRNGNLWRLECIGCGAEVTAATNEDCKSKWERRN